MRWACAAIKLIDTDIAIDHFHGNQAARDYFAEIITTDSRFDDGLQLAEMLADAIRQQAWAKQPAYAHTFSNKVADL